MPTPVAVSPAVSLTLTGYTVSPDGVPGSGIYGDTSRGFLILPAVRASGGTGARVGILEFPGGSTFGLLPPGGEADQNPTSLAGWPDATTPRVAACIRGGVVLWERVSGTWALKAYASAATLGANVNDVINVSFDPSTGALYAVNSTIGGTRAIFLLTPSAGSFSSSLFVNGPTVGTGQYGNACVATGKFLVADNSGNLFVGGPAPVGSTTWLQSAVPPHVSALGVNPNYSAPALVYWSPAESPRKFISANPVTLATRGAVSSTASGSNYQWVAVENTSSSLLAYRNDTAHQLEIYSTADTSDYQTITPLTGTWILGLGGGALAVIDNFYDVSPLLRVYQYIVTPPPTDRVVNGAVSALVGAVGTAISGENGIRLNAAGALSAVATVTGTRGPSTSVAYGVIGAQVGVDAAAGAPQAGTAIGAAVSVTGTMQPGQGMRGGISALVGSSGTAASGRLSVGAITTTVRAASTGRTFTSARGAAAVAVGAAGAVRATTSAAGSLGVLVTAAGTRGTGTAASGAVSAATGAAATARLGTRASGRVAVAVSVAGRAARVRIRRGYLMGPYAAMARHTIDAVGYAVVDGAPLVLGAGTLGLDGAASMPAALTTRSSDFGDPRAKNVPLVWLDADLSADAVLSALNEQRSDTYPVAYVATALTTRVTLGRGSQGRYWQLKVQGQGGALRLRALEAIGGSKPARRTK